MTSSPKLLTLDERLQVACYHSIGAKHPNWELDNTSGHLVCSHCGKPSAELVIRICSTCGDQFILNIDHPRWESKYSILKNGDVVLNDIECDNCY